jgi:glycosyltransferase involved in cell wall biosynthesis
MTTSPFNYLRRCCEASPAPIILLQKRKAASKVTTSGDKDAHPFILGQGPAIVLAIPKISVVVPSYNYARYLPDAIRSVWEQDYKNIELVIVDDCSTDNSRDVLESLKSQSPIPMTVLYNHENMGANKTQNRAVRTATGEFIALLAADDLLAPDRFREQTDIMLQDPAMKIVYANGRIFSDAGFFTRLHDSAVVDLLHQPIQVILRFLYTHVSPLFLQAALIRRDFLLECGGNDENVLADDWVLNIRFFEAISRGGAFAYVDKDVCYYRLHGQNQFRTPEKHARRILEVIETYTPKELRREAYNNIYWSLSENYRLNNQTWKSLSYFVRSFLKKPSRQAASEFLRHRPEMRRLHAIRGYAWSTLFKKRETARLHRAVRQKFSAGSGMLSGTRPDMNPEEIYRAIFEQPASLFDAKFYLAKYPGTSGSIDDLYAHFLKNGVAELLNPNSFFDTNYYLEQYPDIATAGMNPLEHYFRYGAKEGRNPHQFFSTSYYLQAVPVVAASGMNPLLHYLHFGANQGRHPHSLLINSTEFSKLTPQQRLDGDVVAKAVGLFRLLR